MDSERKRLLVERFEDRNWPDDVAESWDTFLENRQNVLWILIRSAGEGESYADASGYEKTFKVSHDPLPKNGLPKISARRKLGLTALKTKESVLLPRTIDSYHRNSERPVR